MQTLFSKQRGFAMPAMFLGVAIAFFGSMNVKTPEGVTVAEALGIDFNKKTEFAAHETEGE